MNSKWYDRSMTRRQRPFILGKGEGRGSPSHVIFAIIAGSTIAMSAPLRAGDRNGKTQSRIVFEEVAAQAGISFRFTNGSRGKHDLPEIMGGGVALFDADSDGLLDIYLCNGGPIDAPEGTADSPCRLFRNRGGWHFEDVTQRAGAPGPSYAMGAASGDFDGDGRVDLFVSGWGDQRLYRNMGNCRFEDVTARAGLKSGLWSTSAAFADLDGDGDLDLYVANYLDFDPKSAPYCSAPDGRRDYCGPEDFSAQRDSLYRNNGDGTFLDVSETAGINPNAGRGLGVLIAELTGDNRPDIYVANDGTPCWLFANQGGLRFREIGEAAGVAHDGHGQAIAGMGIAAADLDGDGHCELVVTNFFGRSTIAFQALPETPGTYRDFTRALGLAAATRNVLGFGVSLADFDGDGRPDLLETNGHVLDRAGWAFRSRCGRRCCATPARVSTTSLGSPERGSASRFSGAGWLWAISTVTTGRMSSSIRSMPPPPCCTMFRRAISFWHWISSTRPAGPQSGLACR